MSRAPERRRPSGLAAAALRPAAARALALGLAAGACWVAFWLVGELPRLGRMLPDPLPRLVSVLRYPLAGAILILALSAIRPVVDRLLGWLEPR
ncbi:MAG: hypothetical protein AAFV49_08525 [Pseudomonadota bacterium]